MQSMGTNNSPPEKRFTIHRWTPPPQGWLKYNTDAQKNRKSNKRAISFFYRDATDGIITKTGRVVKDIHILIA